MGTRNNREIKFRCWDEDHFVYSFEEPGNPPVDGEAWFGFEKGVLKAWVSTTTTPSDMYEPPYPSAEELESPIEDFTGIRDFWQGDILESQDGLRKYEMKWNDTSGKWYLHGINSACSVHDVIWSNYLKVGHIHEELLEQGNE